jgi:hypothetical protein
MSIALVICMLEVRVSGSASTRRRNDGSPHETKPSGARFRMVGRLDHHGAGGVEARPAGAAGDLVELAGVELAHLHAVVLGERREEHTADGHVDAHSQGVGSADHPQQTTLRELLDEAAVLGQHAGVVHADAHPDEPGEGLAEAGGEPELADELGDGLLLLLGDHLDAGECLRAFQGSGLGEVHDVDGRLPGLEQVLHGLVHRGGLVEVVQRYRPLDAGDHGGVAVSATGQIGGYVGDVAEGRRHQDELHPRQKQQRHLPGPTAVRVGVEVELVHDDLIHRCVLAVPQGQVGEDLRGAADDRGVGVHRGVAGHHAHVLGAEDLHQGEELLAHQSLDRCGVEAALAGGEGGEVRADRHQGLAGAGGGGEDQVRP